jgi:hypothetical protein
MSESDPQERMTDLELRDCMMSVRRLLRKVLPISTRWQ